MSFHRQNERNHSGCAFIEKNPKWFYYDALHYETDMRAREVRLEQEVLVNYSNTFVVPFPILKKEGDEESYFGGCVTIAEFRKRFNSSFRNDRGFKYDDFIKQVSLYHKTAKLK